jgi:hypothetical protein
MRQLTTQMKSGESNETADKYNNSSNNNKSRNNSNNNGTAAEVATTSGANVIKLFTDVSYEFL